MLTVAGEISVADDETSAVDDGDTLIVNDCPTSSVGDVDASTDVGVMLCAGDDDASATIDVGTSVADTGDVTIAVADMLTAADIAVAATDEDRTVVDIDKSISEDVTINDDSVSLTVGS